MPHRYAPHLELLATIKALASNTPETAALIDQIRALVNRAGNQQSVTIKEYKSAIAAQGCRICERPASLHHPRAGQGMSQRADDILCIPLCPDCHQNGKDMVWPSIHGAPQFFYTKHKRTEMDLLAETLRDLLSVIAWR